MSYCWPSQTSAAVLENRANASGRTDAGVHAKGMAANVHMDTDMSENQICDYMNKYLPEDICVQEVRIASERFHSRYNAMGKTYCYTCYVGDKKPVFNRKYVHITGAMPDVEAMKKAALTPHIIDADITAPEDWVQYIKTEQITAVVCYNDLLAVECYHALSSAGLRVYEDVSVVGYDNTELSSTALPKITSITHPKDIMGEQAASFLLDWLEGRAEPGYHFMFQPELIRRDSVRNLKK